MILTYAEIAAKLASQLDKGMITRTEYAEELAFQLNKELKRVEEESRPWKLTELSSARSLRPEYFFSYEEAYVLVNKYINQYGRKSQTHEHTLTDGKSRVITFMDNDDDAVTFIFEFRNISQ